MSAEHNSSPVHNLNTKEHISQTVYMHSENMMMLVKELHDNWQDDMLDPIHGDTIPGYWYYSGLLTNNPMAFVEIMSLELGLDLIFDSGKESEICGKILNALRHKRGVPPLVLGDSYVHP